MCLGLRLFPVRLADLRFDSAAIAWRTVVTKLVPLEHDEWRHRTQETHILKTVRTHTWTRWQQR
jgi:hypothetical protein